jgi:HD superfamily phosphodiesterase
MPFEQAGEFILNKIKKELPETFFYHNIDHTLDVCNAAAIIARCERISDADMRLLLIAACYHDSGYLVSSYEHELESCKLAEEHLPGFGFNSEEILADADLDYIGREDFFEIGDKFYRELGLTGRDEWNKVQLKFLEDHKYFTQTALNLRGPGKQENLEKVRALLP